MLHLTREQARRALLRYHFLMPPRSLSPDRILTIFNRLRAVQVDPLDIVGRNAYLVMQSRVAEFRDGVLDDHLYRDRHLVEAWDKVRSIVPAADWSGLEPVRDGFIARYRHQFRQPEELLDYVRGEVRTRGRVSSLDLEDRGTADWHWSSTSAVRAALERLFDCGELAICDRDKGRKVYAPIESVVADEHRRRSNQTLDEYRRWHVLRRVQALGMAVDRADTHWIGIAETKAPERRAGLTVLVEDGSILEATVEGIGRPVYVAPDLASLVDESDPPGGRSAAFLAPLDNVLWDRRLIEDLFGFSYTWEVYKPASKREYGYYVMPVLAGDGFVARWEPRREDGALKVRGWWWEKPVTAKRKDQGLKAAIGEALVEFAAYAGCDRIVCEAGVPSADARYLRGAFRAARLSGQDTPARR